jgi:hypothetical protein
MGQKLKGEVLTITYQEATDFLLPKHYSGRIPSISVAFGWFIDNELKAVCTFGKPASPSLCKGVCGEQWSENVYELNRLCRVDNLNDQLSAFVSACLRRLRSKDWVIVSYADTEMDHNGYIYQACNFIYTGKTLARTDKYTEGNKHSRHYDKDSSNTLRKLRSSKHRYIYFATFDKKLKKTWSQALNYSIEPYPKGINSTYELGTYLQPTVVDNGGKE